MGGTNNVEYALSYPAKMLLVPTSKVHTNWLWVYKQNNTSIREIITRTTAHTIEEASAETAPLEFQTSSNPVPRRYGSKCFAGNKDEQELLLQSPPQKSNTSSNTDQCFAVSE